MRPPLFLLTAASPLLLALGAVADDSPLPIQETLSIFGAVSIPHQLVRASQEGNVMKDCRVTLESPSRHASSPSELGSTSASGSAVSEGSLYRVAWVGRDGEFEIRGIPMPTIPTGDLKALEEIGEGGTEKENSDSEDAADDYHSETDIQTITENALKEAKAKEAEKEGGGAAAGGEFSEAGSSSSDSTSSPGSGSGPGIKMTNPLIKSNKRVLHLTVSHPMFNFEQIQIQLIGGITAKTQTASETVSKALSLEAVQTEEVTTSRETRVQAAYSDIVYALDGQQHFIGKYSSRFKSKNPSGNTNKRIKEHLLNLHHVRANGIKQVFEEREEFNILTLLKNPMVLITCGMMAMMWFMPKPEKLEEMRKIAAEERMMEKRALARAEREKK